MTADRRRKVQARLNEGYSPEDLRTAINGAATAPFVNDQGVKFDDLELICRNGSKLEQFMAKAERRGQPRSGLDGDRLAELSAKRKAEAEERLAARGEAA